MSLLYRARLSTYCMYIHGYTPALCVYICLYLYIHNVFKTYRKEFAQDFGMSLRNIDNTILLHEQSSYFGKNGMLQTPIKKQAVHYHF